MPTKSTSKTLKHLSCFSSTNRKYGEDLAQYNAWQQLRIFQTRMQAMESQSSDDFYENEEKNNDLLAPLVRISLCEESQGSYTKIKSGFGLLFTVIYLKGAFKRDR